MTRSPHEEYRRERLAKRRAKRPASHTFSEDSYQPHDKTRSVQRARGSQRPLIGRGQSIREQLAARFRRA